MLSYLKQRFLLIVQLDLLNRFHVFQSGVLAPRMAGRVEVRHRLYFGPFLSRAAFCDVTLAQPPHPGIQAHRSVLAALSPRLKELFARTGAVVDIPVLDIALMAKVVDFIYQGRMELETEGELEEFREALEFLRIDTAIDIRRLDGPGEGGQASPDPPLRVSTGIFKEPKMKGEEEVKEKSVEEVNEKSNKEAKEKRKEEVKVKVNKKSKEEGSTLCRDFKAPTPDMWGGNGPRICSDNMDEIKLPENTSENKNIQAIFKVRGLKKALTSSEDVKRYFGDFLESVIYVENKSIDKLKFKTSEAAARFEGRRLAIGGSTVTLDRVGLKAEGCQSSRNCYSPRSEGRTHRRSRSRSSTLRRSRSRSRCRLDERSRSKTRASRRSSSRSRRSRSRTSRRSISKTSRRSRSRSRASRRSFSKTSKRSIRETSRTGGSSRSRSRTPRRSIGRISRRSRTPLRKSRSSGHPIASW